MSERDKRAAIIIGTLVLAMIILIWFRRGGSVAGGNTTINNSAFTAPSVAPFGPVYTGDNSPWTFDIPGLDLSGPDLSMIGACCSDCMQSNEQFYQPQYDGGNTYVFNAGDLGPNIYNYTYPAPVQQQWFAPDLGPVGWASAG